LGSERELVSAKILLALVGLGGKEKESPNKNDLSSGGTTRGKRFTQKSRQPKHVRFTGERLCGGKPGEHKLYGKTAAGCRIASRKALVRRVVSLSKGGRKEDKDQNTALRLSKGGIPRKQQIQINAARRRGQKPKG